MLLGLNSLRERVGLDVSSKRILYLYWFLCILEMGNMLNGILKGRHLVYEVVDKAVFAYTFAQG